MNFSRVGKNGLGMRLCIQFELGEVARLFLLLQGIRLAQDRFSSLSTLMVGPAIFFFSVIQLSL